MSLPVRRLLAEAFAPPILLLFVLAAVLGVRLAGAAEDMRAVRHAGQVMAKASSAYRRIADEEGAIRGFGLTGDKAFLEPYEAAHPFEALAELRALVADDPARVAQVDAVERQHAAWAAEAAPALQRDPSSMSGESLLRREALMDSVREKVAAFIGAAESVRTEREEASVRGLTRTAAISLALVALIGLWLGTVSARRVTRAWRAHAGPSVRP